MTLNEVVRNSKAKAVAAAVINDDIELIRNLQYQDVGIQGSIPTGKLTRTATVTRGGFEFSITRTVRSVDDPFDGTIAGNPNDTAPADYRLVEIDVSCATCKSFNNIKHVTTVAPKNLEITSGGGALFIGVFDANGVGVPQANVHIENHKLVPDLIFNDITNNQGYLQLVDVPQSVGGYNITVTKSGYSSDATYPPGNSQNPNPVKTDSTVLSGEVTQASFFIDRVSAINISTTNQICAVVGGVDLRVDGSKLIGTTPDLLKFSTTTVTDAGGNKTMNNLEWDVYNFIVTDPVYDLSGSIPFTPLNLPPNTTQNLQLLVETKNPRALLVTVKDAGTNLPVSGATVLLEKIGYSGQVITGQGARTQTDWSGGAGQINFIDPTKYFNSDGNIDIGPPGGILKLRKLGLNYEPSGWLESSTFDTGASSNFQNLLWVPQGQPPETGQDSVKFQIASNNDNATWNFVGPDSAPGSYYTLSNTNISNHAGKRYIRYRVFLSTQDTSKTPSVSDVSFTYTSICVPPGQAFFNGLAAGTYTLTVSHLGYQVWSDSDVQMSSNFQTREAALSP